MLGAAPPSAARLELSCGPQRLLTPGRGFQVPVTSLPPPPRRGCGHVGSPSVSGHGCCKCPQVTSLLAHCGQALGTGASGGSAGMAQGVLVPDLHIQATKPWGTQEAGARRCSCERLRGWTASQVILAACGHCSANSQHAQAARGASRATPRSAVQGEAAGMAPGGTCSQP